MSRINESRIPQRISPAMAVVATLMTLICVVSDTVPMMVAMLCIAGGFVAATIDYTAPATRSRR